MDRKYENLTIQNSFMLSKVMTNVKTAKRLMENLTGNKIYKIRYKKNNIVEYAGIIKGISMELYLADVNQSVWKTELYIDTCDVFKKDRAVYHFRERCNEVPALELQDGTHRIFVCATKEAVAGVNDEELKAFLCYVMNAEDKRSNLTRMLDDEVRRAKNNSIYEKEYRRMQYEETEASQRAYAQAMQGRRHR